MCPVCGLSFITRKVCELGRSATNLEVSSGGHVTSHATSSELIAKSFVPCFSEALIRPFLHGSRNMCIRYRGLPAAPCWMHGFPTFCVISVEGRTRQWTQCPPLRRCLVCLLLSLVVVVGIHLHSRDLSKVIRYRCFRERGLHSPLMPFVFPRLCFTYDPSGCSIQKSFFAADIP
jgi:hypothetical protein